MKVVFTVGALTACASCANAFVAPSLLPRTSVRLAAADPKEAASQAADSASNPASKAGDVASNAASKAQAAASDAASKAGSAASKAGDVASNAASKAADTASNVAAAASSAAANAADAVQPPPPAPQMSYAVPFLKQPKNLDGLVGNVGFDPFGLAEIFPIEFMREAELKHGRVAMIAVVGWLVSELVHLPGPAYMSENPVDAMAAVGPGPMLQIFFFCGFLEWKFHNGKLTMDTMHEDGNEPGAFGFDPLKLSTKPQAVREKYQLQEIKNGRLAMSAIGGLVHQSLLLGGGVPFHA